MAVTLEQGARTAFVARGELEVEVTLGPLLLLRVERAGRAVLDGFRLSLREGSESEHLIHLTEGVVVTEEWEDPRDLEDAEVTGSGADWLSLRVQAGEHEVDVTISLPSDEHVVVEMVASPAPFRLEASWEAATDERLTGVGARHGEPFDQSGRRIRLGADRRYTGPDCPEDMLAAGGIPQGDYVPSPWLLSSANRAWWAETWGQGLDLDLTGDRHRVSQLSAAGPLRLHLFADPTPASRLRSFLQLTGLPPVLPEWAYGHWKSRDVYQHQRDVEEDWHGYREHELPLDAVVIDSPWETQYNTWRWNRHQFPDPEGLVSGMRADGVRTVVWVTPWTNLESVDGQKPPGAETERLHAQPASNYSEGALGGHFVRGTDGEPWVGKWWMGTGSMIDFTSPAASRWWKRQAKRVLDMGVTGIKADDGEGYYVPPDARFADGRTGTQAAWAYGDLYRRSMQEALDESHPGDGVLFGRPGWAGQQATGITWGGDQVSDWWSLRTLVAASLTAAASGFSNWSHDVGGYLGERLAERCPKELLLRWAAFGAVTPLMQAHGRFEQEAWRYDSETLDAYRELVLLHERLVPYIRAAARTAARTGLPIMRPLCLIDPTDRHGWTEADGYFLGPSIWVSPVLEPEVTRHAAYLPHGDWIDWWTGEPAVGGVEQLVDAPLDRIPMWVRRGAIVVTHPADSVATGLGAEPEDLRPLEATLWGHPHCGRSKVRIADGSAIRWEAGRWSAPPGRAVNFSELEPA